MTDETAERPAIDVVEQSRLVLAGNSHIACFGVPNSSDAGSRLLEISQTPQVLAVCAPYPRPEEFLATTASLAANHTLAFLYSGWNELLFAPEHMFDFVSTDFPALPLVNNARVLPESLVYWHSSIKPYAFALNFGFKQLVDHGARDIVILCPPPPKGDNAKLKALLGAESALLARASQLGMDPVAAPLTPPSIRLKLWGIIRNLYEQEAHAVGARFVGIPPESQDTLGFLKEEYWANDASHANASYGKLYLDHLLKTLAARN